MEHRRKIYFTCFDSINFPVNDKQACGLNTEKISRENYEIAYRTLERILAPDNGGITAYLTLNQIVDSQFFMLPKSFFKPDNAEWKEPYDMLLEGIGCGKIIISTFMDREKNRPHNGSSYAILSYDKQKNKYQENPHDNDFFISSFSAFFTYNVGATKTDINTTSYDDTKKPGDDPKTAGILHFCDFIIAILKDLSRKAPGEKELDEELSARVDIEAPNKTKKGPADDRRDKIKYRTASGMHMNRESIILFIKRILTLNSLQGWECQQPGGKRLYEVAENLQNAREFISYVIRREGISKATVYTKRKESLKEKKCRRYTALVCEQAFDTERTEKITTRSSVYSIIGLQTGLLEQAIEDATGESIKLQPNANRNDYPAMRRSAVVFTNAIYNLQYAAMSGCDYICDGRSGDGLIIYPITTDKGGYPQWITSKSILL